MAEVVRYISGSLEFSSNKSSRIRENRAVCMSQHASHSAVLVAAGAPVECPHLRRASLQIVRYVFYSSVNMVCEISI